MSVIRWGMIGCGAVAEVKSGPGFYKSKNSALLGVTSADMAMTQSFAQRHGVPNAYASTEALLANPEIDAVYVATPPSSHKPNRRGIRCRSKIPSVHEDDTLPIGVQSFKVLRVEEE